jgi:hypothetical protein
MSTELAFRYITRAFALFFLFWILVDVAALPGEIISIMHSIHRLQMANPLQDSFGENKYWVRYYGIYLAENLFKIAVYFILVPYFYRGAPALKRFFEAEKT